VRDELSVLSAFLAVADERSFTRAAKRLNISTSGLSHAIRRLEEQIGVRLLTPVGPIRVDLARRLPFGTLPVLYRADPVTGAILPTSYVPDNSCFGLFGSGGATFVTDNMCVLHFAIGEAF